MRVTLRLGLLLGVLWCGQVRGDDAVDEVKAKIKVATDKLIDDVNKGLREADQQAKTNIRKALDVLEFVSIDLADAPMLVPAEKVAELKARVKNRKEFYQAAQTRGDRSFDIEERARVLRAQYDEFQKKQNELRELSSRIEQLYKQGKYNEAIEESLRRSNKSGSTPSATAIQRLSTFKKASTELAALKGERNRRSNELMKQMMISSMPVVNESGIEFPSAEKWRELTKRRQAVKFTPEEEKLLKALQTPITEEFKGQALRGVLDAFETRYGISFDIDKSALDQLMITDDTQVGIKAKGTSLRSVLKQMLGEIMLTYIIRNGKIYVTTPENASKLMITKTYYVGDLLAAFNSPLDPFGQDPLVAMQNLQALINQIQSIEPQTWQNADGLGGGGGTITFHPGTMSLQIRQSAEMHLQLRGAFR